MIEFQNAIPADGACCSRRCKTSMLTAFTAMSTKSYLVLKQAGLCLGDWASQILLNASSSGQFLTQGIAGRAGSWFDLADASMSTPCKLAWVASVPMPKSSFCDRLVMCRPGLIRRQDVPKFFLQLCRSVVPKNGDKQRSNRDMLIWSNMLIWV